MWRNLFFFLVQKLREPFISFEIFSISVKFVTLLVLQYTLIITLSID